LAVAAVLLLEVDLLLVLVVQVAAKEMLLELVLELLVKGLLAAMAAAVIHLTRAVAAVQLRLELLEQHPSKAQAVQVLMFIQLGQAQHHQA
jgi:hypothetical protein